MRRRMVVETGRDELSHNNPIFVAERDWGAMPVGGGAIVMRETDTFSSP